MDGAVPRRSESTRANATTPTSPGTSGATTGATSSRRSWRRGRAMRSCGRVSRWDHSPLWGRSRERGRCDRAPGAGCLRGRNFPQRAAAHVTARLRSCPHRRDRPRPRHRPVASSTSVAATEPSRCTWPSRRPLERSRASMSTATSWFTRERPPMRRSSRSASNTWRPAIGRRGSGMLITIVDVPKFLGDDAASEAVSTDAAAAVRGAGWGCF